MTLFKIRDSWSYKPVEEECGFGCLCIANITNSNSDDDQIICGGYSGLLHIYQPIEQIEGESTSQANDILLETNLQNPILQIACGNFVSSTSGLHLAVLHPRLLAVYQVHLVEGSTSHGKQCKLQVVYQHKLERTAANMTWGSFGSNRNDDMICVQSLDGALTLFEHETLMFTRFLPSFLLPGPLTYNHFNDSFLTVSSLNCLESYSYQTLSIANEMKYDSSQPTTNFSGKRLTPDWSLNIGEGALDMSLAHQNSHKPSIVVLGERCLFCVEVSGRLRFMKKFDHPASCFKVMKNNEESGIRIIVATSLQLLVYSNTKLLWAAKLFSVPVCIEVGTINNVKGIIVMLQDNFQVSTSYLGTFPSLFTLPRSQNRAVDIDEMEKEIEYYRNQIKDLQTNEDQKILPNNENQSALVVSNEVKSMPNIVNESSLEGAFVPCQIKLKAIRLINNLQVSIQCPLGLVSTIKHFSIPSLEPSDQLSTIDLEIKLDGICLPSCLEIQTSITYNELDESPRVHLSTISVPFSLVAQSCQPAKKLNHRITFQTDKPCIDLTTLFQEFNSSENESNAIGFEYIHGPRASILTSKSNERYRIECEEFSGLWLVVDAFVKRLTTHIPQVHIMYNDKPTSDQLNDIIDRHFEVRKARSEVRVLLEQRYLQYQAIQRRLLSRFKDKTPAPLNYLDALLEGTHEQVYNISFK